MDLGGSTIASLAGIESLDELWSIELRCSRITDEGLGAIGQLKSLSELNVANTAIGDRGAEAIGLARKLRTLILSGTKITDAGIKQLSGLTELQELQAQRTALTDAAVPFLAALPKLECLELWATEITPIARIKLPKKATSQPFASADWKAKPTVVELPLDETAHPQVALTFFGKELNLAVDTGATCTMLDDRYREMLGEEIAQVDVLSSTGKSKAPVFDCPGGRIGEMYLNVSGIVCAPLGPEIAGEGFDGALGIDFLRQLCVDFDFDAGVMRFLSHMPDNLPEHVETHLTYDDRDMPQLVAKASPEVQLTFVIDTGSGCTLSLSRAEESKVFPGGLGNSIPDFALTFHGRTERAIVRLANLDVGGSKNENLLCTVGNGDRAQSSVGWGLLRHYRAIFDFPHDKLVLIPRKEPIADEADMSGLHILRRDGVVAAEIVDRVSPAAEAGIEPGDQITTVDGTDVAHLRNSSIRALLRAGDGKHVKIGLRRGGTDRSVDIVLRRRI
ncbi:MAG TPA: aspartyl protease family protein [Pirellulales bacterium]|nr:aspartyl protease family protein [Pirellulales bacterium]